MLTLRRAATLLCAAAVLGCRSDSPPDSVAPLLGPSFDARAGSSGQAGTIRVTGGSAALQPDMLPASHGHRLTAIAGEGEGIVNVSPEASEPGFNVEIQVGIWNTSPNATFSVKRAANMTTTGVCTSNSFVQFPSPNPGPLVTITTSEGGAGSTHITFDRTLTPDGTLFATKYEVATVDRSVVLVSECFTVLGK